MMVRSINNGPRALKRRRSGFTLVEFIVASTIMSIALLGVYAMLREMLKLEQRLGLQLRHGAEAGDVADHLTRVLESVVNLPGQPAVQLSRDPATGVRSLICYHFGEGLVPLQPQATAIQLTRYQWNPPDYEDAGIVTMQRMYLAGDRNITLHESVSDLVGEQMWQQVDRQVVARHLRSVQVAALLHDDEERKWRAQWAGPAGAVTLRIRVRVGDQMIERLVTPQVNGMLLEGP